MRWPRPAFSPEKAETHILSVHQLPDSRRGILIALKQHGAATIAQLAQSLELTGEAVRQQLLQLQREGWVDSAVDKSATRGRTGRPAARYRLSDAGDHLFPKHYDALSIAVIDAVSGELGEEAALRVLARVSNERVAMVAPALEGLSLDEKVQALKDWYLAGDPYMDVDREGDDLRLVERNCPFYNTAMRRPALCSVSVNALTRLLGHRVAREERFQHGDGRCVFRVYANEPVDAKTWEFTPEPVQ
ncbi:MAG TPA: winged helix-turn-helix transcriptional regulator [Thermoanaerobaculia bacterium]|jgi:predicted ArsR family transcriptional regulator